MKPTPTPGATRAADLIVPHFTELGKLSVAAIIDRETGVADLRQRNAELVALVTAAIKWGASHGWAQKAKEILARHEEDSASPRPARRA